MFLTHYILIHYKCQQHSRQGLNHMENYFVGLWSMAFFWVGGGSSSERYFPEGHHPLEWQHRTLPSYLVCIYKWKYYCNCLNKNQIEIHLIMLLNIGKSKTLSLNCAFTAPKDEKETDPPLLQRYQVGWSPGLSSKTLTLIDGQQTEASEMRLLYACVLLISLAI